MNKKFNFKLLPLLKLRKFKENQVLSELASFNEEILNIGSGNLIKTKQIIDILKKIMKYKGKIIYRNCEKFFLSINQSIFRLRV